MLLSIIEWIITRLIVAIPIVGFVMLFVWGFGSNTQPSKANWAKASLIIIGISFVLIAFFFGSIFGMYPQVFVWTALGDGLNQIIKKNMEAPTVSEILFSSEIYTPIIAFIILLLIGIIIKNIFYNN